MPNRTETCHGIIDEVILEISGPEHRDEDTEQLTTSIAEYIVEGWWALSGGNRRDFDRLILEKRERAVASICSMVSMAHALRSGQGDEWIAETTGAG